MKVALHLLFAVLLAGGMATAGRTLWSEGTRERAKITREDHFDPGPPECVIYKDPDSTNISCCAAIFCDLPTGTTFYFSAPTLGFGQFLIFLSMAVLAFEAWWLRRPYLD